MSDLPLEEHYKVLDASPMASMKEIRVIYRDLAQVWHPDRFQENPRLREKAEAKLKAINQAYEIIRKGHKARKREKSPPKREQKPEARPTTPSSAPAVPAVPAGEAEALGWYAKAAVEGHADSQCIIATMYAEGQLVPKDEMKALEWFRRSAAQGHAAAEFQMGLRYYSGGGGLTKDPQKAFGYYQRAAFQGHTKAQFSLGIMYTNGVHIQMDKAVAHAWFTLAAESKHPDANTLCQSIEATLTETELEGAIDRAKKLRKQVEGV